MDFGASVAPCGGSGGMFYFEQITVAALPTGLRRGAFDDSFSSLIY